MSGLSFNGIHSDSLKVEVMNTKRPMMPETKDEYIDIPGRSGSILIPDKSAKDIEVKVDFMFEKNAGENIYEASRRVGAWLSTDGRSPLIFDDDPSYVYMAKVTGNVDLEAIAMYGEFTIVFRCEPYPRGVI